MDFVRDAQWVKAKEDCEAIGVSVVRLMRDVGPCLKFNGTGSCTKANRVDLLYSDGPDVTPDDVGGEAAAGFDGGGTTASALNWHSDDARGDSMEHQFVDNGGGPGYPAPADLSTDLLAGPGSGLGWRGAYLSLAHRPGPLGTPLPREHRVPGRGPRRRRRHAAKDSEAAAGRTTRSASRPARTASTKRPSAGTPRTACTAGATT